MLARQPYAAIWEELSREKSMIFLSGPRQSGKTTLGKMLAETFSNSLYFNWDVPHHKAQLIQNPYFFEEMPRKDRTRPLVVLDEIHKYKRWKNYLKGIYDQFHESYLFLVMGSGRLDIYQRGGDSLAGRYLQFHLWPLTLAELGGKGMGTAGKFLKDPLGLVTKDTDKLRKIWKKLERFSGFPEPHLAGRPTSFRRWSTTYAHRLIREDIRDLTRIRSVDDVEALYAVLPSKVGSPLSIESLREDLGVAYNTVRNWLRIFQRFYLIFQIPTWTPRVVRAIRKERKCYLLDCAGIDDPAGRFENMIAIELYRAVTCWNDMGYGDFSLHFVKNREGQEVDFLIAEGRKPRLLVEAKLSDDRPAAALRKFQGQLSVPAVQLVNESDTHRIFGNGTQEILVAPAWQWLARLP